MTGRRGAIAGIGAGLTVATLGVVLVLATRGADGVARTLREGDTGAVVQMSVAEQVVVELEGNPTTGFAWEVTPTDAAVIVPAGEPEYRSESDADGSGGTYTFRFTAVGPGEAEVVMVYRRSWEDEAPAATFGFRVLVG